MKRTRGQKSHATVPLMQLRAVTAHGKVLLELVWRGGVSDQAGGEEAPGTLQTPDSGS
jgi:hypothetical protein